MTAPLADRLREASDRVVAHCMKPEKPALMSIPANLERDVDVLLCEAADVVDLLVAALEEMRIAALYQCAAGVQPGLRERANYSLEGAPDTTRTALARAQKETRE
jgi:hypothetical protein